MSLSDVLAAALPALHHYQQAEVEHSDWEAPPGPYIVHQPPAARPVARRLPGKARALDRTWIFRCVNNNAAGAALNAQQVVDALDGTRVGQSVVRASVSQSTPTADPTMTSGYRWSVTVEATFRLPRGVSP